MQLRFAAAALMLTLPASAQSLPAPQAGETYEIRRSYQTASETTDGSSESSSGHTAITERVLALHGDGVELEYDLPADASADDRAREWQFPARVLKAASGPAQLRNRPEIEARITAWLKAAGMTRADCGRWIFTWNAFLIECDPESVLATIEGYDLRSIALREGALYRETFAREPGTLARSAGGPDGATFTVTLQIDPRCRPQCPRRNRRRDRADHRRAGHAGGRTTQAHTGIRQGDNFHSVRDRFDGIGSAAHRHHHIGNQARRWRTGTRDSDRNHGTAKKRPRRQ